MDDEHVEASVFGEDDDEDLFAIPPPLSSLPLPHESGDIAAENGVVDLDGDQNQDGTTTSASQDTKTRKRVSRPQIKLDEARLASPKGLSVLTEIGKNIKLKGKGHEASDLNMLLQHYEHWAQCLMPKWTFKAVVAQCEKLSNKRITQNELHRLRMGDSDDVLRDATENEEPDFSGEITGEQEREAVLAQPPQGQTPEQPTEEETPTQLTEEQMERIRKNRELAMARREALQKRKLLAEKTLQEQGSSDQSSHTATEAKADNVVGENDVPCNVPETTSSKEITQNGLFDHKIENNESSEIATESCGVQETEDMSMVNTNINERYLTKENGVDEEVPHKKLILDITDQHLSINQESKGFDNVESSEEAMDIDTKMIGNTDKHGHKENIEQNGIDKLIS